MSSNHQHIFRKEARTTLRVGGYSGLTLLELVIAIGIFTALGLICYTTIISGLSTWHAADEYKTTADIAETVLETIERDVERIVPNLDSREGPTGTLAVSRSEDTTTVSFSVLPGLRAAGSPEAIEPKCETVTYEWSKNGQVSRNGTLVSNRVVDMKWQFYDGKDYLDTWDVSWGRFTERIRVSVSIAFESARGGEKDVQVFVREFYVNR